MLCKVVKIQTIGPIYSQLTNSPPQCGVAVMMDITKITSVLIMNHSQTYCDQTPESVVFTLSCLIIVNSGEQHFSFSVNEGKLSRDHCFYITFQKHFISGFTRPLSVSLSVFLLHSHTHATCEEKSFWQSNLCNNVLQQCF